MDYLGLLLMAFLNMLVSLSAGGSKSPSFFHVLLMSLPFFEDTIEANHMVDGRLSEDRAIEKLNKEDVEAIRFIDTEDLATLDIAEIFTEPTAKSAPKPKSKPMPRRPPTPPRGRGTSRSPAASPRGSVGRIDHSQDIDGVWLGKGDFPETRMKQSDKALEALGKMMSFLLRGWANDRGFT